MDEMQARAYLTGKFDQLQAAARDHDGAAVRRIVESIAADGYPQVADAITRSLLAAGLRRWADLIEGR